MDTFLRLRRKFNFHKIKLTYRSLGRMAMYIIGSFVVLSFIWIKFFPSNSEARFYIQAMKNYKTVETEISDKLKKNPADENLWRLLVKLRVMAETQLEKIDVSSINPLNPEESVGGRQEFLFSKNEFLAFLETAEKPEPELLKLRYELFSSHSLENVKYHNRTFNELKEIGLILMDVHMFKKAIEVFYMVLDTDPENAEAKKSIFKCLTFSQQPGEVKKLIQDPQWRPYAGHYDLYKYYLNDKSYGRMLYHLTASEYTRYTWKAIVACAVTGLGWILFLVHLGSGWFWKKKEQLLIPAAVILGFFSTIFCLGVVVVQDYFLKYEGMKLDNMVYNLGYCVLGIGLREELCKLLFFLPLVVFLKNIREEYKLLCYCSLVGLGFAIEENLSYFMNYGNQVLMTRFLTANFLHMFTTGFVCFYLIKAIQQKGKAWDEFTVTFLKMVGIHGIYDFFLMDPNMVMKGFDFFAMMLYVYMAMMYLRLLINTAPPAHHYVSLTRVFSIAICLTLGITFLMSSSEIGIKLTIKVIFAGVLGNAIFAYMFYREINEPIG